MTEARKPGWIERAAGEIGLRAFVVAGKRALKRGDQHEANHYRLGIAGAHSAHGPATCDVAQRVAESELALWYRSGSMVPTTESGQRDGELGGAGHHFRTRCSRKWTDAEPDTLTISVCDDDSDGMPFVVFTGSSTWLPADLVEAEVIPWLRHCVTEAQR